MKTEEPDSKAEAKVPSVITEKITLATLKKYKQQQEPFCMLTCYDYSTAQLLEASGVEGILVGDSLAQTVLGRENTLSASMDIMVILTEAVRRGAPKVYLVGDMPFLSYQISVEEAIRNAGRFLSESGCDAVKVEVNQWDVSLVQRLSRAGIPVIAHLGYRPQSAGQQDTIVQTRRLQQGYELIGDGLSMERAGACGLLLECVTEEVAGELTRRCRVPVISCGSGPGCDGQVLVLHEILGLPGSKNPKFCKRFGEIGHQIRVAVGDYVQDVKQKRFPDDAHSYHMKSEEKEAFEQKLKNLDSGQSE